VNTKRWVSNLLWLLMLVIGLSANVRAQSRRAAEIRSCLTSEMALANVDNADPKKSLEENFDIGKRIGYVITSFYQKAIWAMDDPNAEGRALVMYAAEHFATRVKYMSREQLAQDVRSCRMTFSK
jgi:hypothetical protein